MGAALRVERIPNGEPGTERTVEAIVGLAYDPRYTQELRDAGLRVCWACTSKDQQALAIFDWCRDHIRYQRDPRNREFVQSPAYLWRAASEGSPYAAGDCDDFACFILALGAVLGFRCRVILTEDPDLVAPIFMRPWWAHVHTELEVRRGCWRPIDPSMWFLGFGERVNGRRRAFDPEAYPEEVLDGLAPPALGFVDTIISAGAGFGKYAISTDAMKDVERARAHAEAAAAQAGSAYAQKLAELEAAEENLKAERAAALEAERESFGRLEAREERGRMTPILAGAGAALAVGLAAWFRGRK